MSDLINKLLSGQLAKYRSKLIHQSPPAAKSDTKGYITLMKDNDVFYVKYPTGEVFPFMDDLNMWIFYVKSTFVFHSQYLTQHHETVCVFLEKLLGVPKPIRSDVTASQIKLLGLF